MSLFVISSQLLHFVIIQKMNAVDLPFNGKVHLQLFPGVFFTSLKAMHEDPKLHMQPIIFMQWILKIRTVTQNIQCLLEHFYVAWHVGVQSFILLRIKTFWNFYIFISYLSFSHVILFLIRSYISSTPLHIQQLLTDICQTEHQGQANQFSS